MCEKCEARAREFGEQARRLWLESQGNVVLAGAVDSPDGDGDAINLVSPLPMDACIVLMRIACDGSQAGNYVPVNSEGGTLN